MASPEKALLSLKIVPPFWRTNWFYALLFAGFIVLTLLFYRWQLKRKLVLAEAQKAKEIDAFRSKMLGNVSHEFRTPLTLIEGLATEMQQHFSDKELKKGLSAIKAQNQNMLKLVEQLIDLSKMDKKEIKADLEEVELHNLVKEQIDQYRRFAMQKGIDLTFQTAYSSMIAQTDPEKLSTILSNLLHNALKFTKNGGSIKVYLDKYEKGFRLQVEDDGIGIAPQDQQKVFDRFFQKGSLEQKTAEGAGIGLSVVKEYTALLEGQVYLGSEPGRGTRFTLNFPSPILLVTNLTHQGNGKDISFLKKDEATNKKAGEQHQAQLLIVEDNPAMQQLLALQLSENYQLETALNEREGLEKAQQNLPDLIILDWMMPEMEGIELCKLLKSELLTCHIPIIMLTAKTAPDDRITGVAQGADAYLTKPYLKKELLVQIAALLEKKQRLQQKYLHLEKVENEPNSLDEQFLLEIRKHTLAAMAEDNFGPEWLASKLAISRSQLDRKIKALTGSSTSLYLRRLRLEQARFWLENSADRISDIAYRCGYQKPSNFSRDFKKTFDISPSELRDKIR